MTNRLENISRFAAVTVVAAVACFGCGKPSPDPTPTPTPPPDPGPQTIEVTSVSLSQTSISIETTDTYVLTATVKPANATDQKVSWSSSDEKVAKVSGGTVTGIAPGEATITAKAGAKSAICKVKVSQKVYAVEAVTLSDSDIALKEGEQFTLTATVSPSNATDPTVTWSSSDEKVATVSGGVVTAVAPGDADITAKAGAKSAVCHVKVTQKIAHVESVSLSATELSLLYGEKKSLRASVVPSNATDKSLKWSVSDASVVSISATEGDEVELCALKSGEATITVMSVDGEKKATCKVVVKYSAGEGGGSSYGEDDYGKFN